MVNNAGDASGNGSFNDAVGAFALNGNTTGFSNNAMGDSALVLNIIGAANTAVGDLALRNNDSTGAGVANNNMAVGASALFSNVDGIQTQPWVLGQDANLVINGFNNTYVRQRRWYSTPADNEDGAESASVTSRTVAGGRVDFSMLHRWYLQSTLSRWGQHC